MPRAVTHGYPEATGRDQRCRRGSGLARFFHPPGGHRVCGAVVRMSHRGTSPRSLAGALLGAWLLLGATAPSPAQVLPRAAATCVNVMNAEGRKVAIAVARLGRQCVDLAARGKAPDADACIDDDAKGMVGKALAKASSQDAKKCTLPPAFAYSDATTRGDAATHQAGALLRDAIDGGAGLAVIAQAADKQGAKCQKMLLPALDKLVATTLAEFNRCKKSALKTVGDGGALRDRCLAQLAADRANPKGKIAKALASLEKQRARHCATIDPATAFPGRCATETGAAFSSCLERRAACRACRMLDAMDALAADCDLYDDGLANTSCAEAASPFAIAIGDTVSDGVPAPGAGNLEEPGGIDVYVFDAAPGTTIYLDEQASLSALGPRYVVTDEDGAVVVDDDFGGGEPGRVVLVRGGRYTITAGETSGTETGTYGFRLWAVPADDVFAIAVGDTVSDGVPAAGAGNIEVPGVRDVYTFTATAGDVVFVNELAVVGLVLLDYTISDPLGVPVVTDFLGGADPGALTLGLTGTYTITVGEDRSDATGSYSFALSATPFDDVFDIAIGDTVSDGVPGPGAGNIEYPGAFDVYRFAATAGDVVFVNELSQAGVLLLDYTITDPLGTIVVHDFLGGADPGALTLNETGTYVIAVGDPVDDAVGTYSFALSFVPPDEVFAIAIGDTVADGVPAPGAGNIEVPGAFDVYTFAAVAGDVIFVDELSVAGVLLLDYTITDPLGAIVVDDFLGGSDPGRLTLQTTGTYTITVGDGGSASVGTYSFRLAHVPPDDVFAIAIGDTVANGAPGPGAGNIEASGAVDVYTFAATAGDVLFLDELTYAGVLLLDYTISDPSGTVVVANSIGGSDPGAFVIQTTGSYAITVGEARNAAVGTYSFTLHAVPPDDVFAIAIGDTVADGVPGPGAGNIEIPSAHDVYTFTAIAGQVLLLDELSVVGTLLLDYRILDPLGATVLTNFLGGADPAPLALVTTGTYTIVVGDDRDDAVGTYSFRIAYQ